MQIAIPDGTTEITDFAERIQEGDLIYDEDDEEFLPATRWHLGEFAHVYRCVARPDRNRRARTTRRTRTPRY